MRRFTSLFCVILLIVNRISGNKIDVRELKCLVCKATIEEFTDAVNQIDPNVKVEIGGYSIDPTGNLKQKTVAKAQSEVHLSEILDDICEKMDDYVRATTKSDGTLTILKIISNGQMNPLMSEVDVIQDDDLNKSLKYYCEGLLENFEENIIEHFVNNSNNKISKICTEEAKLCLKESKEHDEF